MEHRQNSRRNYHALEAVDSLKFVEKIKKGEIPAEWQKPEDAHKMPRKDTDTQKASHSLETVICDSIYHYRGEMTINVENCNM